MTYLIKYASAGAYTYIPSHYYSQLATDRYREISENTIHIYANTKIMSMQFCEMTLWIHHSHKKANYYGAIADFCITKIHEIDNRLKN